MDGMALKLWVIAARYLPMMMQKAATHEAMPDISLFDTPTDRMHHS